ncbi:HAMP domain-containing protein [Accumulibacter sp.]|uniref:HAMP domain-containing protein n=1 Tax=Accumulibacter sp. TaxID=2053492 RepID=UPI002637647F|nr:HAMP domain-containing protein [Accumulibacter sp.]
MGIFSSKLRIGEKLGLGFGLVGLLFIGVIWHDHQVLRSVLDDYHQLHAVFETRKSLALQIESEMAAAREAEKDFLIQRQERYAGKVDQHLGNLRDKIAALATVDQQSRQTAEELQALTASYQESFHAVADAWRSMGLDENSGIQGSFRSRIHRLHELSANYNVDRLYTSLLQIRRNEKDLALRRDASYRDRVRHLIAEFRQLIEASELPQAVKAKLLAELALYARTFEPYAERVLRSGQTDSGKGPFRDAAQRMEALLDAYHVTNLETNVLKLRRREKDFLLRGDESYPQMVVDIARSIRMQIASSTISAADKELLNGLLRDYQRSFLVLVSRRSLIADLTRQMDAAANRVVPLIQQNADQANEMMAARAKEIAESSQASVRLSLVVMACAIALAIVFAVLIAARIVRPVRQMAGLLDNLAYGTPTGRVATVHGGRDEINAMGESLNALIDHRANFLDWWKASMNEVMALRELDGAQTEAERDAANRNLHAAEIAKVTQLDAIRDRLLQHSECIVNIAQRAIADHGKLGANDVKDMAHAAQSITMLLEALTKERASVATKPAPQTTAS